MEIHFIEYPKFENTNINFNDSLHRWLFFLKEEVPKQELKEVLKMDQLIKKADEKLTLLSSDPETLKEYERREKALSDERTRIEGARNEGKEEGREEGREREEAILNMAQEMLNSGFTLSEVAKFTPYSEIELERIVKKLNQ